METKILDEKYWDKRYENHETGWDIGYPSTPLKAYFDQLDNKSLSILIPGAGNAYEAQYLVENGFNDVTVCDISKKPLLKLEGIRGLKTIHGDFFELEGQYDLIIEQTFFCALHPSLRRAYVEKMATLLKSKGKLVGLLFNIIFEKDGPPFGGKSEEYIALFSDLFEFQTFELAYNSIPPRAGNELFINFRIK